MKNLLIFGLTLFSLSSFAQKAQITILDPDINADELQDDFDVHYGSTHVSSLPDRDQRDRVFSKIKSVQQFDELKKDILFMDLKSMNVKKLMSKYPELSSPELTTMKSRM